MPTCPLDLATAATEFLLVFVHCKKRLDDGQEHTLPLHQLGMTLRMQSAQQNSSWRLGARRPADIA